MAKVETVQGAVPEEDLGVVLVHEHVRFRDEAVAAEWYWLPRRPFPSRPAR